MGDTGRSAAVATAILLLAFASPAVAQTPSGCTSAPKPAVAGVVVMRCRGVTIEIERGADLRLNDRDGNGQPESGVLRAGAIHIDDNSSTAPFQIQTPHAVASVRGTRWAVDVGAAATAVFVEAGAVGVRRVSGVAGVTLTAGEGVDVTSGSGALVVRRWPEPRVRALMARFGR